MDIITLKLSRGSYTFIRKTLSEHVDFLHKVKMPDMVRHELIKDVSKVNGVLDEGMRSNGTDRSDSEGA